jgi:hypothetical protein
MWVKCVRGGKGVSRQPSEAEASILKTGDNFQHHTATILITIILLSRLLS